MTKITFHGAAETVTGSKYLLEADGAKILIDCGLFQGLKELRLKNWDKLPFEPAEVQAVVLTHAHIDHIGFLPRFTSLGYHGPIYSTSATEDLAEILLFDSANNQESDAEYANRKGFSKHHPAKPLYDSQDVSKTLKLFKSVPTNDWFCPAEPFWCRYHDVGHLLGSSMIEVEVRSPGVKKPLRILFSGDVGRYNAPLYHDPSPPPPCDYLICESTYGDRDHPDQAILDQLEEVVTEAVRRGGVILFASFAVGRAQQLIFLLQVLIHANRIPELPIFLDSPMAIDATKIYQQHAGEHDLSENELLPPKKILDGRNVHLARTQQESKKINQVDGPAVIIASSGMMTGGRILHHLKQRLPHENNTVVMGGFMAEGTRGRRMQEGEKTMRMHGQDIPVRSQIRSLPSLSGHAGQKELLRWLADLPAPRQVFLTHGEKQSSLAFAEQLKSIHGWNVHVPKLGESVELENNT